MKFLGYDNILCISPHPDDVEYSIMGTIMKYSNTNFHSFQMCQGGNFDTSTGNHRLKEVEDVWQYSDCFNFSVQFTEHRFIADLIQEEWINLLEKVSKDVDAILLPNDCDSHFEHRFVAGFGNALIRSRPISLIQYMTPSTTRDWVPNLFVDITDQYEKKIECLKLFKSQSHRYYFREDVLRSFHSDFQSSKKTKHYVEQFKIIESYI